MDNIEIVEVANLLDGTFTEHVLIHREDGSQLSMKKTYWDELQAQKELGGTL